MISSPGAATHTIALPKLLKVERLSKSSVDATPITSFCMAEG